MRVSLFGNSIRTPLLVLGLGELLVLYSSLYVSALILYGDTRNADVSLAVLEPRAALVAFVMLLSLISVGLYIFNQRVYFRQVFVRLAIGFTLGSIALACIDFAFPTDSVSWKLRVVAIIYALVSLLILRYVFARLVDTNIFRRRTLVYGAGEKAQAIADLRRKADRRGFNLVGTIPAPGDTLSGQDAAAVRNQKSIAELAQELQADEIVIAMDDRRGNLPSRELLDCKLNGIDVIGLVQFLERESGKIRVDLVSPGWLIFSIGFWRSRIRGITKRTVDFSVSLLVLLVCWPLMLLIAAAIKVEDGIGAPVFYRQARVGHRENVFEVIKFRSMRENAEKDGQAVWAEKNDMRVTRVGAFLRKSRLDELPQVINVLRGQMSIVGPRPERPEFVARLNESIPYYWARHTVTPGITGWAQLKYPYGSSEWDAKEKLQFDLYYVKNHNLLLDFMILLQTVEVVLWGRGAR